MFLKEGIKPKLTKIYKLLVPGKVMKLLLKQSPNKLNVIKSTDNRSPDTILWQSKANFIILSEAHMVLLLLANIEEAEQYSWGGEFRTFFKPSSKPTSTITSMMLHLLQPFLLILPR